MGVGTKIILLVIVLHFIVGFGYLMYKLSPRKGGKSSPVKDIVNSDGESKNDSA